MEELKLYGTWRSPFSRRVEIALKLKGIPYDYIEEDLENKSPELLKFNPIHKKVPVLVHNGQPIVESQLILEYIDQTWPGYPILPLDPYDRAIARFWAKFIDDKYFASVVKASRAPAEEQESAMEEAQENLSFLEKELAGNKYFGGERVGFVDIVGNILGHYLGAIEEATGKHFLTQERHPCLFIWAQDYSTCCTAIEESLPPRDRLVHFFKARIEAIRAKA